MFCNIKELLGRLKILHLEDVNPPSIDVFSALFGEYNDDVDVVSYYITTDIIKKQIIEGYLN